jgi:hypothetical protein
VQTDFKDNLNVLLVLSENTLYHCLPVKIIKTFVFNSQICHESFFVKSLDLVLKAKSFFNSQRWTQNYDAYF